MAQEWPQTWDLTSLYTEPNDFRLVEDIARARDHAPGWQSARRRAWGYLFLLSASGACDDAARSDVVRQMADLQDGVTVTGPIGRFIAGWRQDQAQGLPHPLARAAIAGGLDWRALVSARLELQILVRELLLLPLARNRQQLAWDDCVDLVLKSARNAAERQVGMDLVGGRHVDILTRPGKPSRPFCLAPDPAVDPFISMQARGDLQDALVLTHELQHAIDEIGLGTPPEPLAAEMNARHAERHVLSTVATTFGAESAIALVLVRQGSELIEPLRTLILQIEAAEELDATGYATSSPAHSAAFAIPPLYPAYHILSYLAAFADLPLPPKTAALYGQIVMLFERIKVAG